MGLVRYIIIGIVILMTFSTAAQNKSTNLSHQYESFYADHSAVHVMIRFNQTIFVPTDSLYFTIQLIDRDLRQVHQTMYADIAIINQENNIEERHKIKLVNGIGASAIHLVNLNSVGHYEMLIYDQDGYITPSNKSFSMVVDQDLVLSKDSNSKDWVAQDDKDVQINNLSNRSVQLLLTKNDSSVLYSNIPISDNLTIPISEIPQGLNALYLIDEKMDIVFSSYIINKSNVNVQLNHDNVIRRSTIPLKIQLSDKSNNPINGTASVAVYNQMYADQYLKNLKHSEGPLIIINPADIQPPSNWIKNETSTPEPTTSKYLLSGKAYHGNSNKVLQEGTKIYFLSTDQLELGVARVGKQGTFSINIPRLIGPDQLFYLALTLKEQKLNNISIQWDDLKLPNAKIGNNEMVLSGGQNAYVDYQLKSKLISLSYTSSDFQSLDSDDFTSKFNQKYFAPDALYSLRNYKIFPSMKEMIIEVFRTISTSVKKRKTNIIINKLDNSTSGNPPLIIIDGVPTFDSEVFMNLNPIDLRSVGIYSDRNNLKKLGALGLSGIIIVQTKLADSKFVEQSGDYVLGKLPTILKYQASSDSQEVPSFNSTIHWQAFVPFIDGKSKIMNWTASDDIGRYTIVINGITADGIPFYHQESINVLLGAQ